MLDRNVKMPDWLNQPYKLSMAEVENPFLVLEEYFDHDHLYGNRESLWGIIKSVVTGNFNKRLTGKERENMITFYEMTERLIESTNLVYEGLKSGKIKFEEGLLSGGGQPEYCEEEHPDEYFPLLDAFTDIGAKIPEVDKIFLIKYHARIDFCASILILTHHNNIPHEQLHQKISELIPDDWPTNILIRSATEVYNLWREGHMFYNRICWSQRIKYDAKKTTLPEAKIYSVDIVKDKAMHLFHRISSVVPGFMDGAKNFAAKRKNELAALCLHQAMEHILRALFISIFGFSPQKHNLPFFLQYSLLLTEDLIGIFHAEDLKLDEHLDLLNKSYTKSRYITEDNFVVTDTELEILYSKVSTLVEITPKVFKQIIDQTGKLASSPYFTKTDFDA